MSIRYAGDALSILNEIVSPTLALMSVANPWIFTSPEPLTSHSVDGFPGRQFSATIRFAGRLHSGAGPGGRCASAAASDVSAAAATPKSTVPVMSRMGREGIIGAICGTALLVDLPPSRLPSRV